MQNTQQHTHEISLASSWVPPLGVLCSHMLLTSLLLPMWDLPVLSSRSVVTLLSPSFPLSSSQLGRSKSSQDFC